MIDARSIKLIAQLSSENDHERAAAMSAIDRGCFVSVAEMLKQVAEIERVTDRPLKEIAEIVRKRWPKREPGWRGLTDTKKFAFHRMLVAQHWLTEHERHRLTELNDRLCLASGNEPDPGDIEFMDSILRRAEREGLRI
jgi:hypothetical protein